MTNLDPSGLDATRNPEQGEEPPATPPPHELLAFLAPGLAHALASPLQVIQMQSSLLGAGAETQRARDVLQKACANAERVLDVLRCLSGSEARTKPTQLGVFLPKIIEALRYALRRKGLSIDALHSSVQTPVSVAQGPLTLAVIRLVREIAAVVPPWWQGSLYVDLFEQSQNHAEVRVGLRTTPGSLPFAMTLGPRLAAALAAAERQGVQASWDDRSRSARIRVPAVVVIGALRG